jgi:hypothetical protein
MTEERESTATLSLELLFYLWIPTVGKAPFASKSIWGSFTVSSALAARQGASSLQSGLRASPAEAVRG